MNKKNNADTKTEKKTGTSSASENDKTQKFDPFAKHETLWNKNRNIYLGACLFFGLITLILYGYLGSIDDINNDGGISYVLTLLSIPAMGFVSIMCLFLAFYSQNLREKIQIGKKIKYQF